jgi:hypothetical protein
MIALAESEVWEEYRRRQQYAESILRAVSENRALIEMARAAAELADREGTEHWPTLEEWEREFGLEDQD